MKSPYLDTRFTPDRRSESWQALVATALWLRVGFIGACVVAIALITLFTGEANPAYALASAFAGFTVAACAWGYSWVVLNRADAATAARSATTRPVELGNGVESAVSR